MLQVAVCDDDKAMLHFLCVTIQEELNKCGVQLELHAFEDGPYLIEAFAEHKFDVVFLDICMPRMSGFNVAQKLSEMSKEVRIIFVTAWENLVYESFDYQPFHFIRKGEEGFIRRQLKNVVRRLSSLLEQGQLIPLPMGRGKIRNVTLGDIIYVRSERHYLDYIMRDTEKIRTRDAISERGEFLMPYNFIRIHKRYLVNMYHIACFDPESLTVQLDNNEILIVGRKFRDNSYSSYQEFFKAKNKE